MSNPSPSHFQQILETLDPWIATHVIEGNISAFAIAVETAAGNIFNRVYKNSGQTFSPPQGEAPLFAIGSSSKTITVAAVLKLIEQGKLRLNDRFLEFFPEISVPKQSPLQQITLLHLMRHQSPLAAIEQGWLSKRDLGSEEVLRNFARGKRNAKGKRIKQWDYSALGMVLLGLVVERVSGTRYENYVTCNILRPSGLQDIFPAIRNMSQADRKRILKGHVLDAQNQDTKVTLRDRKAINPSGGYVGSAQDTARFYHSLLTGKILSPAHTKMLHHACVTFGHENDGLRYSPGLQHKYVRTGDTGYLAIGHIGNFKGFCAFTRFYPSLGITCSIMTNSSRLPADREHAFIGDLFPGGFIMPIIAKVRHFTEQSRHAEGTSSQQPSINMPLPPLRRPRLPHGFNPEANPK